MTAGADVELTAICDESLAIRMRASQAGLRVYGDPIEMIDTEKLDAVSICTPPSSHPALAEACLERSIPVLCEKPLATTLADATRLIETAERTKTPFALATKFRLVPEVVQARKMIQSGVIGKVLTFRVEFASYVDMTTRWNCLPEVSGGGVIIDNGCHAFDLVQHLFGPIDHLQAFRHKQKQAFAVEDTALVLATNREGVTGEVFLSWSTFTGSPNYATICGTEGTIEIGWQKSVVKKLGQQPETFGANYDKNVAHRLMVQAFRDGVLKDGTTWITNAECIQTSIAVEAAHRSMASGTPAAMIETVHVRRRNG